MFIGLDVCFGASDEVTELTSDDRALPKGTHDSSVWSDRRLQTAAGAVTFLRMRKCIILESLTSFFQVGKKKHELVLHYGFWDNFSLKKMETYKYLFPGLSFPDCNERRKLRVHLQFSPESWPYPAQL